MRATQHVQTRLYLTTQHFTADIPQAALSCAPDLFVFRCTSPRVLEVLERNFGMDTEHVRRLPQFHYLQHRTSF